MYEVKNAVIAKLLTISALTTYVGDRIYPQHISSVKNPKYPAISIGRKDGGMNQYHTADDFTLQIDVWVKDNYPSVPPDDQLNLIYKLIKATLNLQTLPNQATFLIKEVNMEDDLFEPDTQTWHLSSRYKIIA